MEGIAIHTLRRDGPDGLPVVVRSAARQQSALTHSGTGGHFTRDRYRTFDLEISLHDFGLEESYGRFIKDKIYSADPSELRGSLVDLYV